jgi:hypothetical protein
VPPCPAKFALFLFFIYLFFCFGIFEIGSHFFLLLFNAQAGLDHDLPATGPSISVFCFFGSTRV